MFGEDRGRREGSALAQRTRRTVVAVTLVARGQKTEMNFRQTGFDSAESRNGHADGWGQCFAKLEELLAAQV